MTKILTITNEYESRKKTFVFLSCILSVILVSYVYLLVSMTLQASFVHNNNQRIAELKADIGNLESNYISLQEKFTLDRAHEIGLVDSNGSMYISMISPQRNLSLAR